MYKVFAIASLFLSLSLNVYAQDPCVTALVALEDKAPLLNENTDRIPIDLRPEVARARAERLVEISVGSNIPLPSNAKVTIERDRKNQIVTTVFLEGFDDIQSFTRQLPEQKETLREKAADLIVDKLESANGIIKFIPTAVRAGIAKRLDAQKQKLSPLSEFNTSIWQFHVKAMENSRQIGRIPYYPALLQFIATQVIRPFAINVSGKKAIFGEAVIFEMNITGHDKDQRISEKLMLRYVHQATADDVQSLALPPSD